ncbi:ABC transporter ATP-binding protein [Actinocorallia longicatena]|uniref:ABC transporter ATP-binding protein n=1 Tax=Actinocorallia longicatena TaxID=111803 RepID=A0ABP6Q8M6_9ACTN
MPKRLIRQTADAFSYPAEAAPAGLVLYVVLTVVGSAAPVVIAWFTKAVIDGLTEGGDAGSLLGYALGLGVAGLVAAALPLGTEYLAVHLEREVGVLTQDRLFTAVGEFVGLGRFEDPSFLERLRLAQQAASGAPIRVVTGVLAIARHVTTVAGFLVTLFLINPWMAALVLFSGVPMLVSELAMARRRVRMYWDIGPTERREFFYGQLLAGVEAAKEVRLFDLGAFFRARMLSERRTANSAKRAVDLREMSLQIGLGLMAATVGGAGLIWAISAAARGRLTPGDVTVFVAAVAGVQTGLAGIAGGIAGCQESLGMFDHFRSVTTAGPELPVAKDPRPLDSLLTEGIELHDVWFRYSDEHDWVLKGVNLRIAKGETVALVGLNGAGKSTLVNLLCRFYDPTKGSVTWGGVDVRDADAGDLRRRICAVFQDYMSYDLSAQDNIGLGDLGRLDDLEAIAAAAERAGIHGKLAGLPRGYRTLLTRMFFMEGRDDEGPDQGVVLSGGQWQRLALARALLRDDPDLMILDEPSSGLDAEAEAEIHASLGRHRAGRTSLLISHRLGAVRGADRIVVLSGGVITEEGDHQTLIDGAGEYARLFALQASGYGAEH